MDKMQNCLSEAEMKTKIRKAFNDRKKKLDSDFQKNTQNLPPMDKLLHKQSIVSNLESKLKVELDYFDHFDYHPLQVKPTASKPKTHDVHSRTAQNNDMTVLEFECGDDDVSTTSVITMDQSMATHRKKHGSSTNADVTSEMEAIADNISQNNNKSWKPNHGEKGVEEEDDSTVDNFVRRKSTPITLDKKHKANTVIDTNDKNEEDDKNDKMTDKGVYVGNDISTMKLYVGAEELREVDGESFVINPISISENETNKQPGTEQGSLSRKGIDKEATSRTKESKVMNVEYSNRSLKKQKVQKRNDYQADSPTASSKHTIDRNKILQNNALPVEKKKSNLKPSTKKKAISKRTIVKETKSTTRVTRQSRRSTTNEQPDTRYVQWSTEVRTKTHAQPRVAFPLDFNPMHNLSEKQLTYRSIVLGLA